MSPALILASNSPRRRELMRLLGWPFEVFAVEVDERLLPGESPERYVLRLAEEKARRAAQVRNIPAFYIGADTTVFLEGAILGKPQDAEEARHMLKQLRGRVHQVYSGLAVLRAEDGTCRRTVCVTDVPMRAYTDEEIEAYIQSGDPFDKAGAYAIQHPWFQPVARMEGCFAGVMGFPLCHLASLLRTFGLEPPMDVPVACQQSLNYRCPVHTFYYPVLNSLETRG